MAKKKDVVKKEEKKPDYEERKAIVTEFEGVKFAVIMPEVERSTKAEGFIEGLKGKIGIGAERDVKRQVQATVVSDPRLPERGPIPYDVWIEYWREFREKTPLYQEHISTTARTIYGILIPPKQIDVRGTISPDSIPIPSDFRAKWIRKIECQNCNKIIEVDQDTLSCPLCGYQLRQDNA